MEKNNAAIQLSDNTEQKLNYENKPINVEDLFNQNIVKEFKKYCSINALNYKATLSQIVINYVSLCKCKFYHYLVAFSSLI